MSYCLILNPAAGRGEAARKKDALVRAFDNIAPNLEVHITAAPGDARKIAGRYRDAGQVVIVAGGDGTVHEVINGLVGGNAAMGVIPIGSGNDFVKMLSLPTELGDAINVIKANRRKKIDLGKINDVWFSNGLGIGFDADVVVEANKIERLRGFLIYLVAVLKTLRTFTNRTVKIEVDNTIVEKSIFMISVGNGSCQGGGFYLTPDAKIDDG
ncbi:MAG: YegS/Rv2252/BmrU family lipid kinase, partial [Calditrichota bacterium]